MKQVKFLAATIVAGMLIFFYSCGSGDEKKTDETTKDTTAEKVPETTTTAPAKPDNVMLMQFKVANFAKWKPMYESRDSIRHSYGLVNYVIGRGLDDSNMVLVALKMADANKAKELTASQGMKDRMKEAGVTSKPNFQYIDVVMDDNTVIQETKRLIITHKVKDWDAWKKEFDDHKQARMDAGLIDRGLGHEVDDPHAVTIVLAVTDMAKAKAFIQSKDLKDKMDKAGVEGKPSFFFYSIVQRYQ